MAPSAPSPDAEREFDEFVLSTASESNVVRYLRGEVEASRSSAERRAIEKFAAAAVSSIPWFGGFVSAAMSMRADAAAAKTDALQTVWLEEHEVKIRMLREAVESILLRLITLGEEVIERLQSEEYLALVRDGFRVWDEAATAEKRGFAKNFITNAGGAARLASDDVLRLFVSWLSQYHEFHLAIIREIHREPGVTRYEIWTRIYGDNLPREDSAEADLYRLLIRDMSTGGVIRQARDTTSDGRFVRRKAKRRPGPAPTTMESSFEDTKPYVLTELGTQFVVYTMDEMNLRLGAQTESRDSSTG